jgi:hypothetical protein
MPLVVRLTFTLFVMLAMVTCSIACRGGESPPAPRGDVPAERKARIRYRWEEIGSTHRKYALELGDVMAPGLRPAKVAELHRQAADAFNAIPRDCEDAVLHDYLDQLARGHRNLAELYDECGADARIEQYTPDRVTVGTVYGLYLGVEIRAESDATKRLRDKCDECREKLDQTEKTVIDHIDRTYGLRLTPR